MRIHSDTLTSDQIRGCIENDPRFDGSGASIWRLNVHGSRSRARAFEVRIGANAGKDIHGKTRRPCMGSTDWHPFYAPENYTEKALTYAEWGFFIASLFVLDENAIVGPYKGADDFYRQTDRWGSREQNDGQLFDACDWACDIRDEREAAA